MNKYDKWVKRLKLMWLLFLAISVVCIAILPESPIGIYLTLACILVGYPTHYFCRMLKWKSSELKLRRLTPRQKRRRNLLDRERGKVIQFPGAVKDRSVRYSRSRSGENK